MIRIQVERDQHGKPKRVFVIGHAYAAEPGQDIVCAAVSAVTVCLVNSIEKLTGVRVHQEDDGEDGKVDARVPVVNDPEVLARVHLLMEAMVVSLRDIADEYPQYILFKLERGGNNAKT